MKAEEKYIMIDKIIKNMNYASLASYLYANYKEYAMNLMDSIDIEDINAHAELEGQTYFTFREEF